MSKKILIVDESDSFRQLLKQLLTDSGYKTGEAHNGKDAMEMLESDSIGLVMSDVNMNQMDGITLLRKIKEDGNYRHIPVIMLTSETDDDIITEGRLSGASAWITKPYRDDLLIEAVNKYFKA